MGVGDERAVAIPLGSDGAVLEGLFTAGTPDAGGAVVAPPHPLYGGSMDSPVVNEIAWACRGAGLASLCFNWRGVGASAGAPSGDASDADADYGAALDHLEQTVSAPLAACGYSFGAAAAVRCAQGRAAVRRLVLVAPPPALLDANGLAAFPGRLLVVTGASDSIAPPGPLEPLVAAAARGVLEVIPDVDHFFVTGTAEIGRRIARWFEG